MTTATLIWIDACATSDSDPEDVMRFDHAGRSYAIYHGPDGACLPVSTCAPIPRGSRPGGC